MNIVLSVAAAVVVVAIAATLLILGLYVHQAAADCAEQGGVLVRTIMPGFTCLVPAAKK